MQFMFLTAITARSANVLTAYALQRGLCPLVDFPSTLSFSSRRAGEIDVAEGCLSHTLDIVVIYVAIMVYNTQHIYYN